MGIEYVARTDAGGAVRGAISDENARTGIPAGGGQEISINLRQFEIDRYNRSGNDLQITLADGRVVMLQDYFGADGTPQSRLFISADGYLNEVTLIEGEEGAVYAQYGPTEMWGKWSPSDDLIFLDSAELIEPAATGAVEGEETVSMLGAGLLGCSGLFGAAGAGAAGLVASSALMQAVGSGGGGNSAAGFVPPITPDGGDDADGQGGQDDGIAPSVNETGQVAIGGDNNQQDSISITGTAEPGSDVTVSIGDEEVETTADENGEWEVVFEGDDFPEDGDYTVEVTVTEPDGTETALDGPQIVIDTTPPEIDVTGGTVSAGDIVNHDAYNDEGVVISGTGEPDASVSVTIRDVTHETGVLEDGSWSVSFLPGELPDGDYDADVTIVTGDAMGNTSTITETVSIDTIHPELAINARGLGTNGLINGDDVQPDGLVVAGRAEPGVRVFVEMAGQQREMLVGNDGTWQVAFDPAQFPETEFDTTISAHTQDAAGNVSTASENVRIDLEVNDFTQNGQPGGDDGFINGDEIGDGFTLSGTVEPGSTVAMEFRNQSIPVQYLPDGTWTATVSGSQLPPGTYNELVTITATDSAQNTKTLTRMINVDTEAGDLTLDAGSIGTQGVINHDAYEDGVMVRGTADPYAWVDVSLDDVEYTVRADGNGNWQQFYSTQDLTPGLHDPVVSATITDPYGNSETVSSTLHVDTQVDDLSLAPLQLPTTTEGRTVINRDSVENGFQISGTVEPHSVVWVSIDDVTRQFTAGDDGQWQVTFEPGAIQGGQHDADLHIEVMDPVGNLSTLEQTIFIDTVVQDVSQGEATGSFNGVANLAAAQGGLEMNGTAEPGSTVELVMFNRRYLTTSDEDGNWSVNVPQEDLPAQEGEVDVTINVTDTAGNFESIPGSLSFDFVAPDQPDIVGYFREGGGYRHVTTDMTTDDITVHEVASDGSVNALSIHSDDNVFFGETDHIFLDEQGNAASVPDGSHLVVTSTDAAGNSSATYLVPDEVNTSSVNLDNPDLAGLGIETIDLTFADRAELTVTEDQIRALSDTTDSVVVEGGTDDTLIADGAQKVDGGADEPEGYDIYTLGDDATIIVDEDIDVVT